jgi:rRNA maturation endonuclease Nob1
LVRSKRVQQGAIAVAAGSALIGVVLAVRLAVRVATRGMRTARTGYRAATFRLYHRCPDCKRLIRYEARVCGYCGFRLAAPRAKRGRRRHDRVAA